MSAPASQSFPLLAYCPTHGFFPSGLELGSGAVGWIGNSTAACPNPKCKRHCQILPGEFKAHPDHLSALFHSSISPEALSALRNITERAQRGEITLQQAQTEVAKVAPALSKLFDISNWSDGAKATLYASIIAAITAVSLKVIDKVTEKQQQTIIQNIIVPPAPQYYLRDPSAPPLPARRQGGRR